MPLVGGQGGPEFGVSVNPIPTRGADYAHRITASPTGFENPAAALYHIVNISPTVEKIISTDRVVDDGVN